MKKIVALGRGGVGKSSFIALMAKYLKSRKRGSILLIDADCDQNLADLLGLNLGQLQINTISDLLFDLRYGKIEEKMKSFSLQQKIEYLINQRALYEGDGFDLLSLGTKWAEGCYCQANNILKGFISGLEKNYSYVLIDSPSGLEHLNRRLTSSIDDLFAILDPTQKDFQNLKRARKIMTEIKIKFSNFYLLGNFRFRDEFIGLLEGNDEFKYIGKIEYDRSIEEFNLQGKSLFEIQEDSPMFISVKEVASSLGY